MMKTTANAFAKINLTLDTMGLLPNGYHKIETIFQSVSLKDTISVESGMGEISVSCDNEEIPSDENNICYTAACLFYQKAGIYDGVKIKISKGIPHTAGLGGGSADAAAVLLMMNKIYRNILKPIELHSIASALGADVPFIMEGGTSLGTGIGNVLNPLSPMPQCDIVLVKQGTKPSTGQLYKRLDEIKNPPRPDTSAAIVALDKGDLSMLCSNICNCFSAAWGNEISAIKAQLTSLGALAAELTGSGPTVFGIFPAGKGQKAAEELKKHYQMVYLCQPINCGVDFTE